MSSTSNCKLKEATVIKFASWQFSPVLSSTFTKRLPKTCFANSAIANFITLVLKIKSIKRQQIFTVANKRPNHPTKILSSEGQNIL